MAENEELLHAGHLYSPRYKPVGAPWEPEAGKCRASVSEAGGMGFHSHQCTRKAKVTRKVMHHGKEIEASYCGQHDPVAVAAKRAAERVRWEAEWAAKDAARKAKEEARLLAERAIEALRQIAAGHNDPRSLAIEVLGLGAPT